MAGIARGVLMIRDMQLRAFVEALLTVHPLNLDAFLFEQPLVIGDELGQALKRRSGFQSQCLHRFLPVGRYVIYILYNGWRSNFCQMPSCAESSSRSRWTLNVFPIRCRREN